MPFTNLAKSCLCAHYEPMTPETSVKTGYLMKYIDDGLQVESI
jgi:hypothetical protein